MVEKSITAFVLTEDTDFAQMNIEQLNAHNDQLPVVIYLMKFMINVKQIISSY